MPNAKTIRAIKAVRRGKLVNVGSTDELFARLNADDPQVLSVSPKAFAKFKARLDAPPRPNARLRRTMKSRAPWD
jgi:uncharacterized protein (DUF1778 family)